MEVASRCWASGPGIPVYRCCEVGSIPAHITCLRVQVRVVAQLRLQGVMRCEMLHTRGVESLGVEGFELGILGRSRACSLSPWCDTRRVDACVVRSSPRMASIARVKASSCRDMG